MSKRKRGDDPDLHMICIVEDGEPAIYIQMNGRRIAKRGHPDSPQRRTWISLDPEWVVRDHNYPHGVEVERVSVIMQ